MAADKRRSSPRCPSTVPENPPPPIHIVMADPESLPAETQAWPQRPRALTPRGVAIVVALLIFAVAMAAASVYFRRTQLEKTTAFWGPETIRALQRGETMRLIIPPDSPLLKDSPREQPSAAGPAESDGQRAAEGGPVIADISGTPGLGHFRHALLDERHYEWSTEQPVAVDRLDIPNPELVTVELTGPPADIVPTRLQIELSEGWVGPAEGNASVRFTQRVRPAVRNFIVTLQDIRSAPTP